MKNLMTINISGAFTPLAYIDFPGATFSVVNFVLLYTAKRDCSKLLLDF